MESFSCTPTLTMIIENTYDHVEGVTGLFMSTGFTVIAHLCIVDPDTRYAFPRKKQHSYFNVYYK